MTPKLLRSGQFRGQKGRDPLEKPQEMPHYMFYPRQKNNFQDFQNQRFIGIFMSQRRREKRDERGERREERGETRDERRKMRDEGRKMRDEGRGTRDEG